MMLSGDMPQLRYALVALAPFVLSPIACGSHGAATTATTSHDGGPTAVGGTGGATGTEATGTGATGTGATGTGATGAGGGTTDAAPPPSCPAAPAGISAQGLIAYAEENTARVLAGSPCASVVPALDLSAEKHCAYYSANLMNASCIASPHVEVSTCTDYYAANFDQRETMAGYTGSPTSEDMYFFDDPKQAIAGWIDTIYHRYPILDPWERDFGYGGAMGCDTMDFGSGAAAPSTTIAVYPYDGQTGVSTQFAGAEIPAPPPPPGGWPAGYPISIFYQGTLTTTTVTQDGASTPLPIQTVPMLSFQPNATYFYTNTPLMPNTKYNVHVEGNNGAAFTKDWSFTTGAS
jgi:hypothetical protein